jgi:hypothetical protein
MPPGTQEHRAVFDAQCERSKTLSFDSKLSWEGAHLDSSVLLIVVLVGVVAWLYVRNRQLAKSRLALAADKATLSEQNESLVRDNAALAKYRPLADVERVVQQTREQLAAEAAQAQELIDDARRRANDAVQVQMTHAGEEAAAIVQHARGNASIASAEAASRLGAAQRDADDIIRQAQARAEEIAGEALTAKSNLHVYRSEAIALKNKIEGYGHLYVLPAHSLLDELADAVGFTEAGEKLKAARQRTRSLVKKQRAATCDYAEANRRETAVAFVVDAFNGKVDSVLARVKADNAGTLRQEILDAHALVNLNGRAFRNARIEQEYLDSRLEELRWAAVAHELKNAEREEQRRVKEQIREEEKARREYERAMKDAAKEEETIKKAMEKVRKEVGKANEEQREHYEAQLRELMLKLQEAEQKNQRALSMAQQTKTGHVYIISNIGSFGDDVYKIGLTRRLEPLDRIKELGDASVPFEFDVHALIVSDDAPALERSLHRHFLALQINKVNPRKEFFRVPLGQIRAELEGLGIQAAWTMAAQAAEYRESMAIEKAIAENPASLEAWIKRQLVLDPVVMDEASDEAAAAE